MVYSFKATEIRFVVESFDNSDAPVLIRGFAGVPDQEGFPTRYLMLQRSIGEDEPGFDEGPYVEWCDQGNSCYDCIAAFELGRSNARVVFREGTDFVEEDGRQTELSELLIEFHVGDEEFSGVKQQLEEVIFRGRADVFRCVASV